MQLQNLRRGLVWYADADLKQELVDEELSIEYDPSIGFEGTLYLHNFSPRTAILHDRSSLGPKTHLQMPYEVGPDRTVEVRLSIDASDVDTEEAFGEPDSYESKLSAELEWK